MSIGSNYTVIRRDGSNVIYDLLTRFKSAVRISQEIEHILKATFERGTIFTGTSPQRGPPEQSACARVRRDQLPFQMPCRHHCTSAS